MNLAQKHCVPCEGGVVPLNQKSVRAYLKNVKGWELVSNNKRLQKDFTFDNFMEVVDFVNKVSKIAEAEDHHPDLFTHSYKELRITLSTHAIGGLPENDFILAAKIDRLNEG